MALPLFPPPPPPPPSSPSSLAHTHTHTQMSAYHDVSTLRKQEAKPYAPDEKVETIGEAYVAEIEERAISTMKKKGQCESLLWVGQESVDPFLSSS